jgi:hypothetical protein
MFNYRLLPRSGNANDIEPCFALMQSLLAQKILCYFNHLLLFSEFHRLQRRPEAMIGSSLYLDEYEYASVQDNQI